MDSGSLVLAADDRRDAGETRKKKMLPKQYTGDNSAHLVKLINIPA